MPETKNKLRPFIMANLVGYTQTESVVHHAVLQFSDNRRLLF